MCVHRWELRFYTDTGAPSERLRVTREGRRWFHKRDIFEEGSQIKEKEKGFQLHL